MHTKFLALAVLVGTVLTTMVGCAPNAVAAHKTVRTGRAYGDYGIWGNGNDIVLEHGSLIPTLSIVGDNNSVMVEEEVPVGKLEIWGSNNTVNVPEGLDFTFTQVGRGNKLVYRPSSYSRGVDVIERNTTITTEYVPAAPAPAAAPVSNPPPAPQPSGSTMTPQPASVP